MNKRVAIIGTMGLPAKYGGFETFVHFLVEYLAKDYEITVYCSGPEYQERLPSYLGAKLVYMPFRANGPQSLLFDFVSILHAFFYADVILVLGASGGFLYPFARFLGKRIILNQGGIDWRRSKWGPMTQKLMHFLEASSVKKAEVLVCDNKGIGDYFLTTYGRKSHLIEYGGDQASRPPLTGSFLAEYPYVREPYAFAVARIQADNNIEMILDGFAQSTGFPLVFIGNWASSDFGKAVKARYSTFPHIHLLEAIYDPDVLNSFRAYCSLYVHGHSAGGTNPSLVEAMHLGLSIASFDVVYNRATTEDKALYFKDAEGLAALVRETPESTWRAQSAVMMEIAQRRYKWSIIAAKYAELFT